MRDAIISPSRTALHLRLSRFPRTTACAPKGQHDQFASEAQARAAQVQLIEAELARARNVARRVHLSEPGESRTNAVARLLAGDRRQLDQPAVAADFHLAGTQRARP